MTATTKRLAATLGACAMIGAHAAAAQNIAAPKPLAGSPAKADTPARAQTDLETDRKLGSVYVRCDGKPASRSPGEIAARVLLIMATSGLAGPGEMPDQSKRLEGQDAVAACDAAILRESNEVRKVELTLARAIHKIEAKDYDGALADARAAPGLAPDKASDLAFRKSLLLTAYELQAASLVRLNRPAEAETAALEMAAASPWDLSNMLRARPYVGLTPELTPAKREYLDQLARLWPEGAMIQAEAREWAGDFTGAARDGASLIQAVDAFVIEKELPDSPSVNARRSVDLILAGDLAQSDAVAAQARAAIDSLEKSGQVLKWQTAVSQAEELLDFQAVARMAATGKLAEARTTFGARSRWTVPSAPVVATLTEKLRAGADPSTLTGALARDPAAIRSEALAARAGAITQDKNGAKALWSAVRVYMPSLYSGAAGSIWSVDKSRFLIKKPAKAKYNGELVVLRDAYRPLPIEGMMLHDALLAKARGKAGFLMAVGRTRGDTSFVLFANPGDPGVPSDLLNDADKVITALSVDMPDPSKSK